MNRGPISLLCAGALLFSLVDVIAAKQALGAFALEKMERIFDVVENVFHLV